MSSNLTAIFEVTSIDGQSLSSSLSNDIILAAEESSQTFRFGNFKNGGTTYMSINSNVGIGTSNPLSILHINSINPYLKIQDSANESSILAQLQFYTSTNSLEGFIGYSNNSNLLISNNSQNGSISFQTSNIDRIIINKTGNVGIGTYAEVPLHIYKDEPIIRLQDNVSTGSTTSHLQFYNVNNLEGYVGYTGSSNLIIANSNANGDINFKTSSSFGSTKMTIANNGEISSDGNIGIGTTPLTSLHIVANTAQIRLQDKNSLSSSISSFVEFFTSTISEGLMGYLGTADLNIINSNNSGSIIFKTANINRLTVDKDGLIQTSCNVGIGTTPLTPLHLYDSIPRIRMQDKDNTSGTIVSQLQFYSSGASEGQIGYEGTPDLYITNSNNASVIIKTAGLTILTVSGSGINNVGTIQSTGNIGIGTTPSVNANIHISDNIPKIRLQDKDSLTGTITSLLQFYNANISEGQIGYIGTPDLVVTNSNTNGGIIFKTVNLQRLSIGSDGLIQSACNIGIGTSALTKLHIADLSPQIRLQDTNSSNSNNSKIEFYNLSNIDGFIGYDGSNNLNIVNSNIKGSIFLRNGSNVNLIIDKSGNINNSGIIQSTGNIGIGVSPSNSLHILDNNPQIRLQDKDSSIGTTTSQIQFYNSTSLEGLIGYEGSSNFNITNSNVNGSFILKSGSTNILSLDNFGNLKNSGTIQNTGNIGIGTSALTNLHIAATQPQVRIQDSDSTIGTTTSQIQFYNSTSLEGLIGYEGSSNLNITNSNANGSFILKSGSTNIHSIDNLGNLKNSGTIQNTGNIGIGTSALTNLHIAATQPQIRIQDSDSTIGTTTSQIQFYNSTSLEGLIGYEGSSNLNITNSNANGSFILKSGNTNIHSIDNLGNLKNSGTIQNTGNIGIGTSALTNLHIAATQPQVRIQDSDSIIGTTTSQIQFYNSTSLEGLIGYEGSSNLNITNSNANGSFIFKSAGNIIYTIDSSGNIKNNGSVQNNGNIGIGTSALTNLHIAATQPQIRIQDSDSSTGTTTSQIQFYNSSSLEGLIGYEGTSNLVISNSNSTGAISMRTGGGACNLDRFIINSSGCIGIGTTNPTSILHINGTLNVKRIRIG